MTHKLSDADLRRMADELRAMDPGRWDDLLLASHVMATFKRFQWQPIETAPRDGTVLLGWIGVTWLFFWHEDQECWYGLSPYRDNPEWVCFESSNPEQPTKWMPLP